MSYRRLGLLLALAALVPACGGDASPDETAQPTTPPADDRGVAAQVASYDLAATGEPGRFLVGLVTAENEALVGGTVQLEFAFLGESQEEATGSPEPGPSAEAEFLPVPNKEPEDVGDQPSVLPPAEGVGVYETEVAFDRAGFWQVTAEADVAGEDPVTASGVFRVQEDHLVPQVGDAAPTTDNLTVDDADDVDPAAIDSRAGDDGEVPDPALHETTIAEALEQQRPLVVVFSTPVYCVSQFCGPITDSVEALAERYDDRAAFVHVEVWRSFDDGELNDAFAAWASQGGEPREPWIFAIDDDGRIAHRWDNVLDAPALEAWLEQLPAE